MRSLIFLSAFVSCLLVVGPLAIRAADEVRIGKDSSESASEKEKIEELIKHLENLQDAKFVRNGREYDAKTAAKFVRGKWEANEATIKTAKDFIEKAASESSTTGMPYLIRFKDGTEMKSGEYLLGVLENIETPKAVVANADALGAVIFEALRQEINQVIKDFRLESRLERELFGHAMKGKRWTGQGSVSLSIVLMLPSAEPDNKTERFEHLNPDQQFSLRMAKVRSGEFSTPTATINVAEMRPDGTISVMEEVLLHDAKAGWKPVP